ncbi:alpha/beta fold hydrolase [Zunongwangia endophytica]|uniref:Alpha/beta fold hydrolase n=1 Tax=Zunongwangia endophytica TaxID=1808945 RepID=A0ABV8HBM4_9FLAO|nr:alpha/beta hydrolase [Zunongwangia endophytica]MDN3594642.1 alpha/beta hydrolase [Zunongwangia endophytica]
METQAQYSDKELVKQLPGFTSHLITVNNIQLHYVAGGTGQPLICLPGWPQTWYSFHKVIPELAKKYTVIAVDIRGMGSSDKPINGYDKKTMAKDIFELINKLGIQKAHVLGHDIGGMVASSFAFNYPQAVDKLILMDGAHPSEAMREMSLLPMPGTFGDKINDKTPFLWWMAFNQVKELPEQLLEGRFRYLLDWLFSYVMLDDAKMSDFDREVAAYHYNRPENIRASNAWYQAFEQDIKDMNTYDTLQMPVLGMASESSYEFMKQGLPYIAKNVKVIKVEGSGHYFNEENPQAVIDSLLHFLN